ARHSALDPAFTRSASTSRLWSRIPPLCRWRSKGVVMPMIAECEGPDLTPPGIFPALHEMLRETACGAGFAGLNAKKRGYPAEDARFSRCSIVQREPPFSSRVPLSTLRG